LYGHGRGGEDESWGKIHSRSEKKEASVGNKDLLHRKVKGEKTGFENKRTRKKRKVC